MSRICTKDFMDTVTKKGLAKNINTGVCETFQAAIPLLGDVIQIPGTGNFVWKLRVETNPCSGHWKKMSKKLWDKYADKN